MELKKIKFSHQIFFKWQKTWFAILGAVFSTGRDIASITHLEVKCLLFFQGSETNVPTVFLFVLNTGRQLHTWGQMYPFSQGSETNVPTHFLSVLNTVGVRLLVPPTESEYSQHMTLTLSKYSSSPPLWSIRLEGGGRGWQISSHHIIFSNYSAVSVIKNILKSNPIIP